MSLSSLAWAWQQAERAPEWIWVSQHPAGHVPQVTSFFRRTVVLNPPQSGTIAIAADDSFELFVNGELVGQGVAEQGIQQFDISKQLRPGRNSVAIQVTNREGATAGLAARLVAVDKQNRPMVVVTDATWRASLSSVNQWHRLAFADHRWPLAKPFATYADFAVREAEAVKRKINGVATATSGSGETTSSAPVANIAATRPLSRTPSAGGHLQVPAEFLLEQVAGHADVGSLTAVTFNEFGQMIVAREDGFLSLLEDSNGDSRFDQVRPLGHLLKSCQGLLSINGELVASGLHEQQGLGLYRLTDTDRDGRLDQATQITAFDGDNLEHGPHGLALGPDGLIYLMVGNHTPPKSAPAASSPYRHTYEGDLLTPRFEDPGGHAVGIPAPGGYVLRTDLSGQHVEMYAGGLRNAYDLAFNRQGDLLTHDSDMESDQGTTWYRPTRVFHLVDGAELGWRSGWANWPEYFVDVVPGIADTGRGSPTGMVAYNHRTFPAAYRDAIFSADWSEGRIWVIKCAENGGTYQGRPEVFVSGTPLNVTDLEVGPDGALYAVTGGRGTQGNVYRFTPKSYTLPTSEPGIQQALRLPQISSSWSRQQAAKIKQELGTTWSMQLRKAALDGNRPEDERLQAISLSQLVGPAFSVDTLIGLSSDTNTRVRRQAAYLLGLQAGDASALRLTELLADPDLGVRRRACDSLARQQRAVSFAQLQPLLASPDRTVRWSARRLLEFAPRETWQKEVLESQQTATFIQGATTLLVASPDAETAKAILERTSRLMEGFLTDDDFLSLLRVQQLALHRTGMTAADVPLLAARLSHEYPASNLVLNRELVRLLAYLQVGTIGDRYLAELNRGLPPADAIHLIMHLTYIKQGWTTENRLALFQHLEPPTGVGNGVPGYFQNAARQLGESLSSEEADAMIAQGAAHPAAALAATLRLPEQLQPNQRAALMQLDRQLAPTATPSEVVRRLQVAIVAVLARDGAPESMAYLREAYDRDALRRVEIALGLVEQPDGENLQYIVRSLSLLNPTDARTVITKLSQLRQWPEDPESYRQVILLAQRLGADGGAEAIQLLERWQGFAPNQEIQLDQRIVAWRRWFESTYPEVALPVVTVSATTTKWNEESLLVQLTRAEQEGKGSVAKGREVFVKAQCAKCHRHGDLGEAMGPDLTSVSKRFLKREILESILHPSRVISDQYLAKQVITADGRSYTGIVAPGASPAEVVLLESSGNKIRLNQEDIEEMEPTRTSAMPEGLLNELTLDEILDLFAFLSQSSPQMSALPIPVRPVNR